jgi:KaiC/GvpD/RAD55 family RecA-like ATPase
MEITKQNHLLEILLSSGDVFSSCVGIIKPEYFNGDMRNAVAFSLTYFEKYNKPPKIETLNSEYPDIDLVAKEVTTDQVNYACDEIERYCRENAVAIAMKESLVDLEQGNIGEIVDRMQDAVSVALKRDLGWSFYHDDFLARLEEALSQQQTISTGIKGLDDKLNGGFARKQVSIFTANSGAGKSIMLNNLAHNYSVRGYHVVLLSLELPKEMVFTRTSSIVSGYNIKNLAETKLEVSSVVEKVKKQTNGSLVIQRINGDATTNDIRAFLTHYELELGRKPDVLLVDYLDKMTPNQGVGRLSISEQDKYKSEQLAELAFDYDVICASASQQNREAIGNPSPNQSVIAGGLTKIQTVDNVISLYMDEEMRLRGEMKATFLKTRSSDGVGKWAELYFDSNNLRITDATDSSNGGLFDLTSRRKDLDRTLQLPGLEQMEEAENTEVLEYDGTKEEEIDEPKEDKPEAESDELLNLMNDLDGDY